MEEESFAPGARVAVLTTQPVAGALDYLAPEGGCVVGDYVEVPLGPRRVAGVVWGAGEGDFPVEKLRQVTGRLDVAPMRPALRAFLDRAASYTLTPLPMMLRLATRAPGLGETAAPKRVYRRGNRAPDRMTEARARVLAWIDQWGGAPLTMAEITRGAGCSASVVTGLAEQGVLAAAAAPRDTPYPRLDPELPPLTLAEDQAAAARALRDGMAAGGYGTTLLQGVTGSGKTEVYLEAVAECLARGRQALVLLPEIALTAEFLTRVEARFGARPAEWHSGATSAERRRCWKMVAEGQAQCVVGARSSLFLPFRDLGLIVVDEEHDSSYKQEEGVLYNARDMAVLRASEEGAQVVLASATPSLESWVNAEAGKYTRLRLESRFGAAMPGMDAIDMRVEDLGPQTWLSPTLKGAVAQRLTAGEQALLFLNRRGFAPVTLCRACGHQLGCPDCDARLVEHRFLKRLMCHQCGETQPMPEACPACGVEGKMAAVGPGVERVAEEAQAAFPDARVEILSSDRFGTARELKAQIAAIADGGADIIVGTQLVAKGHNFPKLTLVGVIDADLGLQGSDLRAAERTFQLMRQVAGRAGRAERAGQALLQTYQPEHPVIRAILTGAAEDFWRAEAGERQALGMPPFGRMAGIILSGTDLDAVHALGRDLAMNAQGLRAIGAEVWGPAPAPIARVRGRYRVRLLVKAPRGAPLQSALAAWAGQAKLRGSLRLSIDIDPQSFL